MLIMHVMDFIMTLLDMYVTYFGHSHPVIPLPGPFPFLFIPFLSFSQLGFLLLFCHFFPSFFFLVSIFFFFSPRAFHCKSCMTSAFNSAPKLAWIKFYAVPRAWFQSLWSRNLKICDPKRTHPPGVIVGTRQVNLCQVLRVMCGGKDNAHWKWVVTVASRTATEINIQNNRNKNQRRCMHFCRNH